MCLQGREKGTQQTPTPQMATGWDPAAWAGASPSVLYGSGMSGLLGSPSSSINLNLSDFVDTNTSTQHNTGIRSTPSAAAGSAAQLHDEGQQLITERDSAHDDVTEHERDQWYFFESIHWLFILKYSFAIFLKVFVCYLFESIRLLFVWKYSFPICLKVFVCYLFESIRLLFVWKYSFDVTIVDVTVIFAIMDSRNYELWTARNCDMNCCEGSRGWMCLCLCHEWRK